MDSAKLTLNGHDYDLPTTVGEEGEVGIDIGKLRSNSGAITLDPGYGNTGSCRSAITFVNGEEGILRYRGIAIDELCEHASFEEVAQLLVHGELPSESALKTFHEAIVSNGDLPAGMLSMIDAFPANGHPMGVLASMTAALSTFYPDADPLEDIDGVFGALMGRAMSIAAAAYRKEKGLGSLPEVDPSASYAANFLRLCFSENGKEYKPPKTLEHALDMLLIVHADHEQNCSTSSVRMVGSSHANIFASITAGICGLWGPRHGGANQAVLEMLEQIQADGGDCSKYMELVKDKESGKRLMGFGHRVYKNFDPRAKIMKKACDEVLGELGVEDPLLDIARKLESIALEDDFFVKRKLYPNVDFYSGIVYRALGIPTEMFTVMFALGRLPGWLAHWKELRDENSRIHRPRQIYTGYTARPYVPMAQRG
jgi:citrate synthase